MADSRRASRRHYSDVNRPHLSKFALFSLTILSAFILTFLFSGNSFTASQEWILFLLFFAIGLWLTEAIPPFAVGILIIGYLVYTQGYLLPETSNVQKYVNTWASPVIWLMLGGFFLAEGMQKSKLDLLLFRFTIKLFGSKPKRLLLGLMLTTALASMIMSNTATAAMMIASVMPFVQNIGKDAPFTKAMLLGIPVAASVGGMGTIIGSPPNAIAVGALSAVGIEIDFLTWMLFGLPVALVLTVLFWSVLIQFYSPKVKYLDVSFTEDESQQSLNPEELRSRRIVLIILAATVGLWVSSPLHKIPVAVVSALPIVFLTMLSVIRAEDVRQLPWDTLMLVAGGLALGLALVDSGLAKYFVRQIELGHTLWLICLIFGILTVVFSNIMSNTATSTILIPIGIILMSGNTFGMLTLALVTSLAASTALFLPVSTPPNAIAFSTGLLKQSDFRLGGGLIGLVGPLIIIAWVLLVAYLLFG